MNVCFTLVTLLPKEGAYGSHRPRPVQMILWKGGGPAAGSPTATLLRLSPDHRTRRGRQPSEVGLTSSGAPSFRGLTGGVYKAQEHIHRSVADLRLLAIPAS
jgi:hypothetical protein